MRILGVARRILGAVAVVVLATLFSTAIAANAVTAGFIYLLAVLSLAVWQGFLAGMVGSLLATACFNFFFFPPIGTFHIADPQNWISLVCFLVAATIASELVVRERRRADEARSRQREVEALYALCVDLFTASATPGGLDAATARALRTIGTQGGGLVLLPEGEAERAGTESWVGAAKDLEVHRLLDRPGAAPLGGAGAREGWRNVRIPVQIGGRTAGHLVAYGTRANQEALESVARLVGLAFERERLLAEQARLEALRASDSLKSSLLRAVSHDLTTPLTAILVSLESLRREVADGSRGSRTFDLLVEETSRLDRRIRNLLAMARVEAGAFVPRREPTPPADLFRAARENLRLVASSRRIECRVAPGCADLDVDPSLALEVMVNLVENAHRASPPGAPVDLEASPHPSDPARVRLEVLDRGRGLQGAGLRPARPGREEAEATAGDVPGKGLGLEIARSFVEAQGGSIELLPREGGGVVARVDLPAAAVAGLPAAGPP